MGSVLEIGIARIHNKPPNGRNYLHISGVGRNYV